MRTAWISRRRASRGLRAVVALALGLTGALALVPAALGATPGPHLSLHSAAVPSTFSEADNARCEGDLSGEVVRVCDAYQITVTDSGSSRTDGTAVTIKDTLPPGVQARGIGFFRVGPVLLTEKRGKEAVPPGCTLEPLTCKFRSETIEGTLRTGTLKPDEALEMEVYVTVGAGASGPLTNSVSVSGGGAPAGSTTSTNELSAEEAVPFGVSLDAGIAGLDGAPETQAGGHPYEFTTRFDLGSEIRPSPESSLLATAAEDLKDAVVELPPGFLGSATAAPTCTFGQLASFVGCPPASRVGYIDTEPEGSASANSWIYNMLPEHGVAAEFGYTDVLNNTHAIYATVVPTPAGYVLRASAHEVPQIALTDVISSFFGDPLEKNGGPGAAAAFFTTPSDCSGAPLLTRLYADSWQSPGRLGADGTPDLSDPNWKTSVSEAPPVTGCEALAERFDPTISAQPSSSHADSPTGLEVDIKVPQDQSPETLAVPPLRDAVVTLPEGMSVNPSSANGLEACSLAQVGIAASGAPNDEQPTCPQASRIGTVELESPALASEVCVEGAKNLAECPGAAERESVPLRGSIYLARQGENPFGSLLAIYIVIDDARTGVLVKLAGKVEPNQSTGQLQTVVDQSPQLPFSELRTHFFAGNRASLKTSAVCGTYTVTSSLTPWSAPESGPPATPSASFETSQPAAGGACPTSPAAEPNHPAFTAGTLGSQAGAYSPFVVHGARADGDQPITQVNVTLPKGLTGKLAGIPYCPESGIALAHSREHEGGGAEELADPACPAASEVGVVAVGAGAGPEPFYVTGHAYLTGPYKGAPLGIAIVSPAVAGPFDLGDVVVRAALDVDPLTTQITAVSDPIPTILDGIPLDIRSIDLEMSHPQFTLNPTNCEKTAVTGEAVGQFGSTAALSEPFQVGGCKNLAFRPKLQISLKGSTRHAGHPGLRAVLTYPKSGAYANVASAQVNLPHSEFIDQGNLNKACTRPVLLAGACPASTIYGKAKAWTPLLERPLEGPVYLVGGFGYKLPALVAELGGQIRVLLVGKVDSGPNHGIRNTFEAVPDAPVEKFVLEMKGGPKYSLLENSEDLCRRPQRAIASFTAQSGATLRLAPRIANGCGKSQKAKGHGKRAARHRHKGHGKKR